MAVTSTFRQQVGTAVTLKSSGGTAALTLASLANGSYRQSAKFDLGATYAQGYAVHAFLEMAATPTAGNTVDIWANPSTSATAATDNCGGCSGSDAAYTGYSSDAAASVKQLQFVGSGVFAARATTTVQKIFVGNWYPSQRYNSLVVLNGAGSAVHSNDANCVITLTPLEGTAE